MGQGPKGQKIKRLSLQDRAQAWDLYFTHNQSSSEIAKTLGVSPPAILITLKKMGGVIRSAQDAHRLKPFNEHAFDTLNPEACYWLGAWMTDGCLYDEDNPESSPRMELTWENTDKEHLRSFDVFMGGDGSRVNTRGAYSTWDARSSAMAEAFMSYGIRPRKTKTACPPDCLKNSPDFWRGCIDGDGEVDEGSRCPIVSLTGSFPLIEAYCEFCAIVCPGYPLKPRPSGHTNCTSVLHLHGAGAMGMLTKLYGDHKAVAMPRKMKKAQELLTKYAGKTFRILKADIHQRKTFPYAYTDLLKAQEDFKKLKALDASALVTCPHKGSIIQFGNTTIERSRIGVVASHTLHERTRMSARVRGRPSPLEQWEDEALREKIIAEAENRKHSSIRASMSATCQLCWGFSPAAAKAVYQHFCGGLEHVDILDPCAGWGDRMTAALSLNNFGSYLGFDPNSSMNLVYERIINCYGGFGKAKVHIQPFEDAALTLESCDIAFTSPPYMNYEEYSDDIGQSYKRYPEPEVWREKFLATMLRRCADALRPRGILAINISDAGVAPLRLWLGEEAEKIPSLRLTEIMTIPTGNFDRAQEGIYCWRKI